MSGGHGKGMDWDGLRRDMLKFGVGKSDPIVATLPSDRAGSRGGPIRRLLQNQMLGRASRYTVMFKSEDSNKLEQEHEIGPAKLSRGDAEPYVMDCDVMFMYQNIEVPELDPASKSDILAEYVAENLRDRTKKKAAILKARDETGHNLKRIRDDQDDCLKPSRPEE